jgi:two-component system response regulator NreC
LRDNAEARTVARREGQGVGTAHSDRNRLTRREREVATLLAYGHTNHEVATKLVISVRTAEMHRANLMRKLGLERRAQLVRWALDNGLLR